MQTKEQAINTIDAVFGREIDLLQKRCDDLGCLAFIFGPTGKLAHLKSLKSEIARVTAGVANTQGVLKAISTLGLDEALLRVIVSHITGKKKFQALLFSADMAPSFTSEFEIVVKALEPLELDDRAYVAELYKQMKAHSVGSRVWFEAHCSQSEFIKPTGVRLG